MKVLYTAPNRAHHYKYAVALHQEDVLLNFISGFSRFSPRAEISDIGDALVRADTIQNLFVASLRLPIPLSLTQQFEYASKLWLDRTCLKYAKHCNIFLFYTGCGLWSSRLCRDLGAVSVLEAVSSHISYQERLLATEFRELGLTAIQFHHPLEKERRLTEIEECDYILTPSEFVRTSYIEMGISPAKLLKVPYGFQRFKEQNNTSAEIVESQEFVVLYVGAISVRKGLRYLINAFNQFKHPRKKLVIVGPKVKPSGLENIAIPDNVEFPGVLKGRALEKAYRRASVFCLPSLEEGLALVLGEALSYGIPILASDHSGAEEIISDGCEGFIFPCKSSVKIAECLQILADDKTLYESMRRAASTKAASLDGWDVTGKLLVKTLNSVSNVSNG